MKEMKHIIQDELGIHARPASLLVKVSREFQCKVTISKDGNSADAKSILRIMGLGVKKGDEITMTFNGSDEAEALTTIKVFLETNI